MDAMDTMDPSPITRGVLVRVRPKDGRDHDVEELLDAVLRLSTREDHTVTSFLMRFADGAYGLLDLFADEPSRRAHLAGPARQAIAYRSRDLLQCATTDVLLDVLHYDLPTVAGRARLATGTWITFDVGDASDTPDTAVSTAAGTTPHASWITLRSAAGTVVVMDLATTHDEPEPSRLPEVSVDGRDARLVSSDRFRLLGPDVPEPEVTPLPHVVDVDLHDTIRDAIGDDLQDVIP